MRGQLISKRWLLIRCALIGFLVLGGIESSAINHPFPLRDSVMQGSVPGKRRFGDLTPNVTKGCIMIPDQRDHWPNIYEREAPQGFGFEDFLAVLVATQTINYSDEDLNFANKTYATLVAGQGDNDFKVYVSDERKMVLIGFSASNGIATDLNVQTSDCKISYPDKPVFDCGEVHQGFYKKYLKHYKDVVSIYLPLVQDKGYKLLSAGGSQGGAVASIAALHAKHLVGDDRQVELYTMSAPEFQYKMPSDPFASPDVYKRYVTSYINNYDHAYHYQYFCIDDVAVLPTALTTPLIKFFHLVDAIHVPCHTVIDGVEQPQPPDDFTFKTLRLVNWHCHVVEMYETRFTWWYLGNPLVRFG